MLDEGFWAGMTLYPVSKCTPERAVDMVEMYGPERLLVNSAGDWGPSKPTAVPDFILAMRLRGHPESLIRRIVYENPLKFFSQSRNFDFTPPENEGLGVGRLGAGRGKAAGLEIVARSDNCSESQAFISTDMGLAALAACFLPYPFVGNTNGSRYLRVKSRVCDIVARGSSCSRSSFAACIKVSPSSLSATNNNQPDPS